jgi:cyclase
VASTINIPFTVGGGISSVADVEILLQNGADGFLSILRKTRNDRDLAQRVGG